MLEIQRLTKKSCGGLLGIFLLVALAGMIAGAIGELAKVSMRLAGAGLGGVGMGMGRLTAGCAGGFGTRGAGFDGIDCGGL